MCQDLSSFVEIFSNFCIINHNGCFIYFINRSPTAYQAYLLGSSDREFSVSPSSGELPPVDNQGTLLIVSFTPTKYGKVYRGKLVVQVSKQLALT